MCGDEPYSDRVGRMVRARMEYGFWVEYNVGTVFARWPSRTVAIRAVRNQPMWRVTMKKNTFAALAVAIAGLAGMAVVTRAAPVEAQDKTDAHHTMYAACAKVCADCMLECEKTVHHCTELVAAGKKDHVKPMQLAADCAEFCALSAKLTGRHSDLAPAACEACAKACDMCAAACDKFQDMPEMKACAESCKKCAASCREMAKMAGHKH